MQSHVPSKDHTQADIAKVCYRQYVYSRERTKGVICFSLRFNSIELFACDTQVFLLYQQNAFIRMFSIYAGIFILSFVLIM